MDIAALSETEIRVILALSDMDVARLQALSPSVPVGTIIHALIDDALRTDAAESEAA